MTSSQIFWGWGVYLTGALACILALWWITGSVNPRIRRLLRMGTTALLVTPWWHSAEVNILMPALWVMLFDGVSHGFPEMARAGLPLVAATAVSGLIATSLPVSEKSAKKIRSAETPEPKPEGQTEERQEPTL